MSFTNARPGAIRMPSLQIPNDCHCSWVVVKAGPVMEAVSEMKHMSNLCPRKYEHERMAEQSQRVVIRSA